jgi:hypothetical protein
MFHARRSVHELVCYTDCSLKLTECSLKLTECSLNLFECSLKLTECSLEMTECSLKLTELSLQLTGPGRDDGFIVRPISLITYVSQHFVRVHHSKEFVIVKVFVEFII